MMEELIIATKNKGKLAEMRQIFAPYGISVIGQEEAGIQTDVVEDGASFRENAEKKAVTIMKQSGRAALADDSGLCVDALDGRPGIFSARYAGEGKTDAERTAKLLEELAAVPDERRTAHFQCDIALALPEGKVLHFEGRADGTILRAPQGTDGFGYDPIFYEPALGKTFAELTGDEKNRVSHRGKALAGLIAYLKN